MPIVSSFFLNPYGLRGFHGRNSLARIPAHWQLRYDVEIVVGLEAFAGEAVTVPRITRLWLGTTGSGVVRGGSLASRATPECCDPRFY